MIKVEVFCDHSNNANTYLITKDDHAIIIDPANNLKTLSKFLENTTLDAILLTHGHYDHFKELENIINKYNIKCYMHKDAKKKVFNLNASYAMAFGALKIPDIDDNMIILIDKEQILNIADFEVKVLFTPGHTNCSVSYIIENNIFSGDTLFKNSVGRCDLATGNSVVLKNTLEKIKKLKINYKIYPGHDEETSLDVEIKNNPYLK